MVDFTFHPVIDSTPPPLEPWWWEFENRHEPTEEMQRYLLEQEAQFIRRTEEK